MKRLSEQFRPGDYVEIKFKDSKWRTARVLRHDPPGIWVQDQMGYHWFVTNTRNIRARKNG